MASDPLVEEYLLLGLALGRHVAGMVDAYYGPPELARRAEAEAASSPAALVQRARRLLADLDPAAGAPVPSEPSPRTGSSVPDGLRRRWLAAQVSGLHTTARKLAGEPVGYLDEVEACYGVRPEAVPEEDLSAAHAR
ncbi:MAG TPA: hypothetical protein VMW49_01135, partial [Candidatus Dormibacteraeota bacterium]|nr:hypothetical protein [Candidatus Dormibacteraeota bacterium]